MKYEGSDAAVGAPPASTPSLFKQQVRTDPIAPPASNGISIAMPAAYSLGPMGGFLDLVWFFASEFPWGRPTDVHFNLKLQFKLQSI